MKIVLRILNISSTWILPNHHHLHLWNSSYFSISDIKVDFYGNRKWWTRETSVTLFCLHLGRTCLYQLCTSEFLSHLYSSQSQYKCVMFCKSCFWEHPVICIFFSMPVSILWFVLINHIFLQVHWFVSNAFFFFQEMCLYECYLSSSVKLIYSTVTQSPKGSCHHIMMTISQNIQQESLQTTSNKKQPTIVLLPHIPDLNIMSQH